MTPGPIPLPGPLAGPRPGRRAVLAGLGSLAVWAAVPHPSHAAGGDPRFVLVVLRGALDGLAAVAPLGDPAHEALRGPLAAGTGRPLDGFFAINPALVHLAGRFAAGEALVVHAVATPYRGRSHFDGQDVLENGHTAPHAADSGWLNRAVTALPAQGTVRPLRGLGVGATVPAVLRGAAPTLAWAPPAFQPVRSDTVQRLADLYDGTDAAMAEAFRNGQETLRLATSREGATDAAATAFRSLAMGAGRLLAAEDGPRVAALDLDGWDTHADEGPVDGRLAKRLAGLDRALEGLAEALGPAWRQTAVAVVTEFGRTAAANGTAGTDHGTATVAILCGGAVRGGRVHADWPGLQHQDLYEGRDLRPTIDLRAVMKGVLRDHLGLDARTLGTEVFPGSLALAPLDGLIR